MADSKSYEVASEPYHGATDVEQETEKAARRDITGASEQANQFEVQKIQPCMVVATAKAKSHFSDGYP
jgi:hypothetical protein